jgi:HlyD family secretion protein
MSEDGLLALGQTQQMIAIAEVYQSDIGQVKVGQKAFITGQAFEGKLEGNVIEVGRQVQQQNVFSNEPGENLDRRIIEVKIRITPQDSRKVEGLTNLQVQTQIEV